MSNDPSLIRILTVDDHPLLRKGIAALVNAEPDMKLIAEASNGQGGHRKVPTTPSRHNLDGSPDARLKRYRRQFRYSKRIPECPNRCPNDIPGDVQVLRALRAGARGYILKGHVHRELLETIRAVHAGQKRIPPEIAAQLAEHATDDDLSSREIDVLRLIAAGTQ